MYQLNFIWANLHRELIFFIFNVTSHIYTHVGSWMTAFASHPKLQPSHLRALFLICRAYLLFKHNHHFCKVYDMFTTLNIFVQMHSFTSSHTYMHYINALHRSNPTKTCPWSGIGTITLKSFKKLYLTKTCLRPGIAQNLQKLHPSHIIWND